MNVPTGTWPHRYLNHAPNEADLEVEPQTESGHRSAGAKMYLPWFIITQNLKKFSLHKTLDITNSFLSKIKRHNCIFGMNGFDINRIKPEIDTSEPHASSSYCLLLILQFFS